MKHDTQFLPDDQLKWIQESKMKAERKYVRLRKLNSRSIISGLLASTFATVLAGYTAALNSPLTSWRWTCAIIAVFTLFATVSTGLQKQFDISGSLSKVSVCVGRLNALELAQRLGIRTREEIVKECEDIALHYPEYIG